MKKTVWPIVTENFSYKAVSLFIALILWMTILGRRDFVYTRTVDVELRPSANLTVVGQTADRIRVRVSGSRAALKRFMEAPEGRTMLIDVSDRGAGMVDIDIPTAKVEVPVGVKILSIRPNVIRAELAPSTGAPERGPSPSLPPEEQ